MCILCMKQLHDSTYIQYTLAHAHAITPHYTLNALTKLGNGQV